MSHALNRKVLSWLRCGKCGLIALRNAATQKALSQKCPGDD